MTIIPLLLKELDQEAQTTRKMLQRVPTDKLGWKPHEKSMTMQQLSVHIAELPSWIEMGLNTSELDFATSPYMPSPISSTDELLKLFEKSLYAGKRALENAGED